MRTRLPKLANIDSYASIGRLLDKRRVDLPRCAALDSLLCGASSQQTSCIGELFDRIVELLGIVSPGNKSSRRALESFVDKAVEAIVRGYHLLIVDLFPPGPRDPQGIHGAIWSELSDEPFTLPASEPLTLAAYSAGTPKRAFVEPTAVGRELLEMPLFLEPEMYVNAPLEATYQSAFRGVPRKWQALLANVQGN